MEVRVEDVSALRFDDGTSVRAASAVVPFDGGWLVAQDDATHGARVRPRPGGSRLRLGPATRLRLLPPVSGADTFDEASGTKGLKPDLEAAFVLPASGGAVVLLGSGSSPRRMRAVLVEPGADGARTVVADLPALYAAVAERLAVDPDLLNLEGACVLGDAVRWFHRGLPSAGVPTASVDVDLADLVATVRGELPPGDVDVRGPRRYDLGTVQGVGLAVTDAVPLTGGTVLVSAAAEDTADPRDDGPVVGSVLALLDGETVAAAAPLPDVSGAVPKIEGLAVVSEHDGTSLRLLATVDADDTAVPSLAVVLRVSW